MKHLNELVRPFRALRPRAETAAAVIAPPYDVVSTAEAREIAADRPDSFLHVSRPEIDLPAGTNPRSRAVYARGAENFARLSESGVLIRDTRPSFYIYRMSTGSHVQTGVALTASVAAYDGNRVRKHELTMPEKEQDRVEHMTALNAQTGPVLCAHRSSERIRALVGESCEEAPLFEAEGPNRVKHTLWQVAEPEAVGALADAFNGLESLYIADGHHRSAAASRVAAERRIVRGGANTGASHEFFLVVAFPHDELRILDCNRAVADLAGRTPDELLEAVGQQFGVESSPSPCKPDEPGTFGMYLAGRWYRLRLRRAEPGGDPVAALDISRLRRRLIEPLLGVADPRTDKRIEFVGGVRGLEALEARVDSGNAAVAFALYPTTMDQLMAVADADQLMPPKSTWFEPKLADGLLSHVLEA
ncbi:DUF1015 domain-containing protein [Candidatus Rariloculus sp.]|uniref:DUF1015 domain-containing protein n=1 Tax=Candidatus Rariloculus sp. TaxID=3101265 RepID=UPI003D0C55F2